MLILDAEGARVIGVMVEKSMTTPDHYPMTINAVVVACNQVSNRDPVVFYDDVLVERTLRVLADEGFAKMVHRPGDRMVKYRSAIGEVLGVSEKQIALLAVLMLRGAQTPGELRQRTIRYVEFETLADVEQTLRSLQDHTPALVAREVRRPGQKEHRYHELLSVEEVGRDEGTRASERESESLPTPEPTGPVDPDRGVAAPDNGELIARLSERIEALEATLLRLVDELGL